MQDLLIPVEVVAISMLRDESGIVYDSHLVQMNTSEIQLASKVFPSLIKLVEEYLDGIFDKLRLISQVKFNLEEPDLRIDYLDIVQEDDFSPIVTLDHEKGGLVIIGVTIKNQHHLMDNIVLAPYEPEPTSFFKKLFVRKIL
jgi:pantoate--beta-alanine ligase